MPYGNLVAKDTAKVLMESAIQVHILHSIFFPQHSSLNILHSTLFTQHPSLNIIHSTNNNQQTTLRINQQHTLSTHATLSTHSYHSPSLPTYQPTLSPTPSSQPTSHPPLLYQVLIILLDYGHPIGTATSAPGASGLPFVGDTDTDAQGMIKSTPITLTLNPNRNRCPRSGLRQELHLDHPYLLDCPCFAS